jgi:hypothetical protein
MTTPFAVYLQPEEATRAEQLTPLDRPLKRRRRSHVRYHDILYAAPAPTPQTNSLSTDPNPPTALSVPPPKKQDFICPIAHCQKSFHHRSVRDRHVENIHGVHPSLIRGGTGGRAGGRPSRSSHSPNMDLNKDLSQISPEEFIWNELLGVAV